ncbi:restriction endonuclease subunit S [Glaesserella parasuis]|uniref:restriction endonuclease subunit S n=1 Tax=Glaesserella parasuis TaxID=738 RepID=UPI00243705D4|nr:restriction endonuclease subunit S [Glaesserella parasuis]MDG6290040.1 restriction endonuclease subunit S [Glaesserella parasuis]MDG6292182.1 restriction endonuclease subunit S [Glaesserella parasuis]
MIFLIGGGDETNPITKALWHNKKVVFKALGEVATISIGLTYTPTYVEKGIKFISAQNTSKDYLDLSNVKYISEKEFENSTDNAKPQRDDILFTRVGSNIGHPVIVETDEKLCIFVSLGFLRVKDNNFLFNRYLKYWMSTDLFWKQVEKNVHGSAKINLNTGWLKDFKIPIPPFEEQQRIVAILDKFETLTNSIVDGLPKEIELRRKQYEYYREKLLSFPQ